MLLSLRIENFALIDDLDLAFGKGLNVLTGETGAGKSILLDAIDLILGGKVTSGVLRTGFSRTLLEGSFAINESLVQDLATVDLDLLEDDLLVCSREISMAQGTLRSRFRVNGVVVNKQQIAWLREQLVEVTVQGQALQVGRADRLRQWLDDFGGKTLLAQRQQVAVAFAEFQRVDKAREAYRQDEQQRLQRIDGLQYQLQELEAAHLSDSQEQENLEQALQRLNHGVELQKQSYQVYQWLYERDQGEACADLLGRAEAELLQMSGYDPALNAILELVQQALTQVQEAGYQINAYGSSVETDPQQLHSVEDRLLHVKQICRKYGPSLGDAIAYHQTIQQQYAELTQAGQSLEALEQAYQQTQSALCSACAQLTRLRQVAGQELEDRLLAQLKPLALEKVQFQVQLQPVPPNQYGADQIQFMFSANPGEALQPLAEAASGGEMSRFLLAFKACFSQGNGVDTLIFDEIDAGVSGHVAQAIATKLYHLSQHQQVLCVTHQPMIAAMADTHFQVQKQVVTIPSNADIQDSPERTIVQVTALNSQQRRQELAKIAGGQSTEQALTFVDSLLQQALQLRQANRTETAINSAQPNHSARSQKAAQSKAARSKSTQSKSAKSMPSSSL